jgi:hypothetical protein
VDRAPLRWRPNIHRAVAWLTDEKDHTSFGLEVLRSDGAETLPEVYALERSNPVFKVARRLLQAALTSRLSVLVNPKGARHAWQDPTGREGTGVQHGAQSRPNHPHEQEVLR